MRMEDSCLVGWISQSQLDVLAGPQRMSEYLLLSTLWMDQSWRTKKGVLPCVLTLVNHVFCPLCLSATHAGSLWRLMKALILILRLSGSTTWSSCSNEFKSTYLHLSCLLRPCYRDDEDSYAYTVIVEPCFFDSAMTTSLYFLATTEH